ncbi:uncharacterized protein LY89DRAFT_666956 [Mollisia scopiformis]|uniref:Uncharacterized protein n=1 Tax=Mollisia scopiformis TaxID=149040 RepID=A0A194XIS3_MOLSC|nr:uncharacterized protein LY89DRAFT_666956 [Mollisia scopiformis]KUJ20135.1 hypothetical protein LY89DRAFT_666956 [Mollisia scopiformis]
MARVISKIVLGSCGIQDFYRTSRIVSLQHYQGRHGTSTQAFTNPQMPEYAAGQDPSPLSGHGYLRPTVYATLYIAQMKYTLTITLPMEARYFKRKRPNQSGPDLGLDTFQFDLSSTTSTSSLGGSTTSSSTSLQARFANDFGNFFKVSIPMLGIRHLMSIPICSSREVLADRPIIYYNNRFMMSWKTSGIDGDGD